MLERFLMRVARRIADRYGYQVVFKHAAAEYAPERVLDLTDEAAPFVRALEAVPNVTGEYRRHQVYARLLKIHPDTPRFEIAWAIEKAVRRLKGWP